MADKGEQQDQSRRSSEGGKSGPTTSQVVAVVTLLPIGGFLLTLSGLTLTGTIIGLTLASPLFLLFSPILVPAAIAIALAVAGFWVSGAFGLTGLSSLSWIVNYVRGPRSPLPEPVDYAKRQVVDTAGYLGQRTKEVGQSIQNRAHEVKEGGRT